MTKNRPIIGRVRSSGKSKSANKPNSKIVTVPMDSDIDIGDYVAFVKIDNGNIGKLIGVQSVSNESNSRRV